MQWTGQEEDGRMDVTGKVRLSGFPLFLPGFVFSIGLFKGILRCIAPPPGACSPTGATKTSAHARPHARTPAFCPPTECEVVLERSETTCSKQPEFTLDP